MAQWEYCKVDLGTIPSRSTDVDLLNDLGNEGWELVNIMPNSIAYLKRELPASVPSKSARRTKPAAAQVE
jgi:hypothetical protein